MAEDEKVTTSEKATYGGQPAAAVQQDAAAVQQDVERINISEISGPLVLLYGPVGVGKTVTLLRLCSFLSSQFDIEVDRTFREDREYERAVKAFEDQMAEPVMAPASTGAVNFLLLNVIRGGNTYCQILEAPGEHFFPSGASARISHPFYLQRIFAENYRKVFVLFFEPRFLSDDTRLGNYIKSFVQVLQIHGRPNRDRVVIVFNKCDEKPALNAGGRPSENEFRKLLYGKSATGPLQDYLRRNRFGRVHFVPFSSGHFGVDSSGRQNFAPSANHHPRLLWNAIDDCITWLPWWKRIFR